MRLPAALGARARGTDWAAAASWLLCFALIGYLGLRGGGYDPLVHDQVGIAIWWIALAGVAVGALPRRRLGRAAWAALGLLAVFLCWTALSLEWTQSVGRTWADVGRVAAYLGVFALGLFTRTGGGASRTVSAVAAGVVLVAAVALLSRLHPAWFPEAGQTALFIDDSRERLSYPINYWNGLAVLIAIGLPPVLQVAAAARSLVWRGLATAALPALALTAFFTLSRGGIAATVLALAVYLALAADRLPKLLAAVAGAAGGALLIAAAAQRDALREGLLDAAARRQGDEMLAISLVVCLAIGLVGVAIGLAMDGRRRPRWTIVSRRHSLIGAGVAAVACLLLAGALDAPGRVADGWDEFRAGGGPGSGTGRLGSVAGQSRYELWQAAIDQNATRPLSGTGSGTFELWWAREGETGESVRDTHSLYLQTLGELGVVGLLVLAAFLTTVFLAGARGAWRAPAADRSALAAALAGCVAFCLAAVVDWMWQIPVIAVTFLLLASQLLIRRPGRGEPAALGPAWRLGFAVAAIAAIAAISIAVSAAGLLRQSEADAREGNLPAALEAARSAQNVQPGAAAPRLQQALVLEQLGRLGQAAAAAEAAIDREPTDWRPWFVLARIEARRGHAVAAVARYRRARALNPQSELFDP